MTHPRTGHGIFPTRGCVITPTKGGHNGWLYAHPIASYPPPPTFSIPSTTRYPCRNIYRLSLCTGPDEATRSPTVVPNPEGGNDIYIAIKNFGDASAGIATQCMKASKCFNARPQYYANITLMAHGAMIMLPSGAQWPEAVLKPSLTQPPPRRHATPPPRLSTATSSTMPNPTKPL
ncbi:hypothetical protein F5888DRAFT_1637023 [Russula emetica]|nr:hypothetical protein F5888DRAFT_1637023 [Russula emetica]